MTRINAQAPVCYDLCTRKQWEAALRSATEIVNAAVALHNHVARHTGDLLIEVGAS